MNDTGKALAAILVSALVIASIRFLPFVLFRKGRVPRGMEFVEKYMPPVAMTVLVAGSLAGVGWMKPPHGAPEIAGVVVTALVHLWKRNVLLSICAGTGLYMVLRAVLAA